MAVPKQPHQVTPRKKTNFVAQPIWHPQKRHMTKRMAIGCCAENLVTWYLEERGWQILAKNYETKKGEIDIIAAKNHEDLVGYPTVAFVEVKSRTTDKGLPPETNVTSSKKKKIIATMKQWIGLHARVKAVYRCDIASVILVHHALPRIQYFKNAFCEHEAFGW